MLALFTARAFCIIFHIGYAKTSSVEMQSDPRSFVAALAPFNQPNMKKQLILLTVAALATVGVSGQTDEFARLLQKARSGDTEAQMTVAEKYRDGDGTERNDEKAIFWYSKLASPQHPEAEHILGIAFLMGLGTECDFDKGVEWLTRAALHGSIEAQFDFGCKLLFRQGISRRKICGGQRSGLRPFQSGRGTGTPFVSRIPERGHALSRLLP